MKFDRARNSVKLLLALCVMFGAAGVISNGNGTVLPMYSAVLSLVCFVMAFVVIFLFCKCPYCGKVIYLGLFKATHCPKCRRSFETGAKKKGKR